jgi:hypothetical protein
MTRHKESRARFRKLPRKEPDQHRVKLSYRGRTTRDFLVRHANDDGWLSEVCTKEDEHKAAYLAQSVSVHGSGDRRNFYGAIGDLLAYGDDGEVGCLVIDEGWFRLTRFDEFLGRNWRKHDEAATTDRAGNEHLPSIYRAGNERVSQDNPTESHNTETATVREDRSKKIEVLINSREAETSQASPPSPSSNPDGKAYDAETLQREVDERRKALGHRPLRWAGKHINARTEIVALAAEHPDLVEHAFDAWCADESQRRHGHIPSGLVMHWPRYTAELKQRQHAQQRQLRGAQRALEYYQELARAGGQRVPMSLAELEPGYLEKIRDEYPGLDLSQVRSRPRVVAAEPEQRGGEPGNVADDLGLAKCLANPEI